ncbi:MAG: electron transport complex subunit RsxC [Clostridia bacterium]|nr:electron transport complex subunit RsxC [Clostridia bacterium]
MFGLKFLGKTHIPHNKNTADLTPVKMTPPKEVLLPMAQHIGAPATPVVKVGDEVKVGQLIAEPSGYVSSPIYSSVSGKVTKIDNYLRPDGKSVPAIRIESDGEMSVLEGITPPEVTDFDSFIGAIRSSGLVGLGGAGFPTSVKLDAVKNGGIHTIVINGAECEPYITSDTRTMLDQSEAVYDGIALLEKYVPTAEKFIFGIEKNKPACIEEMARIFQDNPKVSIMPLPSLYPQGAEKVIIYNTTGLTVPEGKLPADVGVLVINVTSLAVLANYVKTGMPLVEKCVTVDGSAVKEPKNVVAPIGTSIREIIEFAGGLKEEAGKVIFGGPMMGIPACSLDEPISKTTNAITVFNVKEATEREASACIHCGRCVSACPMGLNPTAFSKALGYGTEEKMEKLEEASINLCMECGCCSYVCPASRPLVQNNRLGKTALREYKAHKASLK